MELFKAKSEYLQGKRAKDTIESIAYTLAKRYDMVIVEDIISAITLNLDGGPEQWRDHALYILNKLNKDDVNISKDNLTLNIKELIKHLDGWFTYERIDKELGILSTRDKSHRRKVLHRLVGDGLLEHHPERSGIFQKITQEANTLNWQDAKIDDTFPVKWPFGLERRINLYSKNLAIVAGSPNAGKSALLLNFIEMNMDKHNIHYFSSEMGPEELKLRLSKFDIPMDSWKFEAYERATDFARVIRPDDINIIDYLEIGDNFFTITDEFRAIFDKLNKGIAVIALQKKFGANMGRGAEFGMEKPRLYMTMDSGELIIQKAKNWATKDNPNKLKIKFKLIDGAKFIQINEYHEEDERVPF